MNTLQDLVDDFFNIADYLEVKTFSTSMFRNTGKEICFNSMPLIIKKSGKFYIQNPIGYSVPIISLFQCIEGFKVSTDIVTNAIIINGVEWDGSKTNIELFR